ncbi:unnamed protein product [Lasius platythorax]|uniref:Uncharacterized protein n=1 Tax=Lasius platythorax TaxID=488582 RepID=A0AAV2P3D4_9HYME
MLEIGLKIDRKQTHFAEIFHASVDTACNCQVGTVARRKLYPIYSSRQLTNVSARKGCEAIMTSGKWRETVACN